MMSMCNVAGKARAYQVDFRRCFWPIRGCVLKIPHYAISGRVTSLLAYRIEHSHFIDFTMNGLLLYYKLEDNIKLFHAAGTVSFLPHCTGPGLDIELSSVHSQLYDT